MREEFKKAAIEIEADPKLQKEEIGKTIDATAKGQEIRTKYLGDINDKSKRTRVWHYCSSWPCWESQKVAKHKDSRPLESDKNKFEQGKNRFCDGKTVRRIGSGEDWKRSSNSPQQSEESAQCP